MGPNHGPDPSSPLMAGSQHLSHIGVGGLKPQRDTLSKRDSFYRIVVFKRDGVAHVEVQIYIIINWDGLF